MINILEYVESNKVEFFNFLNSLLEQDKKLLIIGETCEIFRNYKRDEPNVSEDLEEVVNLLQEIILHDHTIYLDVRVQIGHSSFFLANLEEMAIEKISIKEYLISKEKFVNPDIDDDILTLNFKPFYENYPSVRDYQSIGSGVDYLNKFLSSKMFNDIDKWKEVLFNYIKLHKYDGQQLILNDRIKSPDHLITNIKKTINSLNKFDKHERYDNIKHEMQSLGFEKGLGKDANEIKTNLQLLDNLFHSPDNTTLKEFLAKIPMIFNIAIVSPHGYFAQQNVLGLPDSGGQIVYILDQVKALEKALIESLNA